jgi:hypothetical protein
MRHGWILPGLLTFALPCVAAADDFAAGSLIIPMDTDYQDMGMLRAYGLVYELLRQNVPVRWVIKTGKQNGDTDFTASAMDVLSGAVIADHGYRGGPWVVDAADVDEAMPIIEAWLVRRPLLRQPVLRYARRGPTLARGRGPDARARWPSFRACPRADSCSVVAWAASFRSVA